MEILRQPKTFWQWLSRQEGSIITEPNPLTIIENELERLHDELERYGDTTENGYDQIIQLMDKLIDELVRCSKEKQNASGRKN